MFGFGKAKEEVDPDPNKIIVGWTGLMQPPKWQDKDASGAGCHHCKEPFKAGHQHNVRRARGLRRASVCLWQWL